MKKKRRDAIGSEVPKKTNYSIYDYEIYVDGIGKIKKVKEQQLFSMPQPT